jgi:hypothetical protein
MGKDKGEKETSEDSERTLSEHSVRRVGSDQCPEPERCRKCYARFDILEYIPSERHSDLMGLFEVFMVYGEDRSNRSVQHKIVLVIHNIL